MDIPLNIENATGFIVGKEELKQTIELLLKNYWTTFLQNASLGARFSIHTEELENDIGITDTLSQIRGLVVEDLKIVPPDILLTVNYNGDVEQFQFNLDYEN